MLFASVLSACAGSMGPYSPSTAGESVASMTHASAAKAAVVTAWSRNVMRVPLPHAGCFKASYPALVWSRIDCVRPPNVLFPPRSSGSAIHPDVVGNGADYSLVSLPQVMSGAIGSFPNVSGVKTVRSVGTPDFGGGGASALNVYSLQLNSNTFSTAACAGMAHCLGWEQFVYTNQPNAYNGGGNLIIQDWLLSSTSQRLSGCPPNAGWQKSGGSCVQNGPNSVFVVNVPITELRELTLSGSASSSGDSAFLAVGSVVYGLQYIQGDGITDLSQHWTGAEFNVVGNGGGTRARFNAGSTITVRLEADTGSSSAPSCLGNSGTTGESNNLSFIAPPSNPDRRRYPSITFNESNAGGGGTPGCTALPST
jgi:hypothetical protein